jgi:hypothetical protein
MPADFARVRVNLTVGSHHVALGRADVALRDARLTAGDRAAIVDMVRAVQLLGRTFGGAARAGIDDAQDAVTLTLRDPEATEGGPWTSENGIAVGATNALAGRTAAPARRGVLLPVDVALHELTHLLQFRRMPANAKPSGALLEGLADSVALLVTGDSLLGEGYFANARNDVLRGAVRDLDPDARRNVNIDVVGPTLTTYAQATRRGVDEHDGGGVVSTIFLHLAQQCGRDAAERIVWAVIEDADAWKGGGTWRQFNDALRSAAAATGNPAITTLIDAEILRAGLTAAK